MVKTATVFFLLSMAAALPAYSQTMAPGGTATAPSRAMTPAPSPTMSRPSAGATPSAVAPRAATAPGALAANQFSTEPAAKAHCPADTIVWVNLGGSKAYHTSGDRFYGKTRHGAYMCQKEADQAGFHAPGHRPSRTPAKSTSAKTSQ
ncbi:MAG: hypothetical protein JO081_08585 [Alphaproteobacteria bacterium]|nr:hypothetical protein [Alphaproteobacteria bacterium]